MEEDEEAVALPAHQVCALFSRDLVCDEGPDQLLLLSSTTSILKALTFHSTSDIRLT